MKNNEILSYPPTPTKFNLPSYLEKFLSPLPQFPEQIKLDRTEGNGSAWSNTRTSPIEFNIHSKNSRFLEKNNTKKIGGCQKNLRKIQIFWKKTKNLGVPKQSEIITDFLKKKKKNFRGVPKKSEKIPDFWKKNEKKSVGTKKHLASQNFV